jgi:hypothetical protein
MIPDAAGERILNGGGTRPSRRKKARGTGVFWLEPTQKKGAVMDVSKFTREDLILAGVALLLAIDLLFLPWFDVSVSFGAFHVSATSTATGAPDGWLGVLAVLTLVALVADLAIDRLGNGSVEVPAIGSSRATTRLVLAVVAAGFVVLKFLFHIHFSLFGIGFWAAVVLTAALVVVAARARDAERAVPTLA